MHLRAVDRGFTQINAYFLVMNSKRYNNNNNNNNNKCKDKKQVMVRMMMIKHIRKRLSEYIQLRHRILLKDFKI